MESSDSEEDSAKRVPTRATPKAKLYRRAPQRCLDMFAGLQRAGDVAEELRRLGFRWFPTDDAGPLGRFLADPDPALLAHNRDVARTYLSLESMTEALRALFDEAGWIP